MNIKKFIRSKVPNADEIISDMKQTQKIVKQTEEIFQYLDKTLCDIQERVIKIEKMLKDK